MWSLRDCLGSPVFCVFMMVVVVITGVLEVFLCCNCHCLGVFLGNYRSCRRFSVLQLPLFWSVFGKLQESLTFFSIYNCRWNFLYSRNYRTHSQAFPSTTAIKFSCFREITAPTHNFLSLQLPTQHFSSINFTGDLTCFHTLQLP